MLNFNTTLHFDQVRCLNSNSEITNDILLLGRQLWYEIIKKKVCGRFICHCQLLELRQICYHTYLAINWLAKSVKNN